MNSKGIKIQKLVQCTWNVSWVQHHSAVKTAKSQDGGIRSLFMGMHHGVRDAWRQGNFISECSQCPSHSLDM